MSIQHAVITDPDIHEPKGVATATAGSVYKSDGAGSGSWVLDGGANYGEILILTGATAQTLAAASAYSRLQPGTEWEANLSSGTTITLPDGTITVSATGVYQFNFWINFNTAALAAGTKYYFKYAVNGVVSTQADTVTKITNGVDALDTFASALVSLTTGDIVSIHVAGDATSSSTNITPTEAAFSVILLKAS